MRDPAEVVRAFYESVNRGDVAAIVALYDPNGRAENVVRETPRVVTGREALRELWADEIGRSAGALIGHRRVEIDRVAAFHSGWGWVRAEWHEPHDRGGETARRRGYTDFWIEDGLIRRQRRVLVDDPSSAAALCDDHRVHDVALQTRARPVVGVGAVIVTHDGRVVLVKRRKEPLTGQWSLPGGALELGETIADGTAREVREETGLDVDVGPVIEVFDRILMDETGQLRYHFVLIDSLCRVRGGMLAAGSDADAVVLADPAALEPYALTEKARSVILRGLDLKGMLA
jgi:ADP-ribose pyrophosphatase YjhB (NUDIX family)